MARFPAHLDRRPAVITGASSGIGAATAETLAGAGHPVVMGARRVERCEAVAHAIRARGGEAIVLPLDMAEPSSVESFVEGATSAFGSIEVLVSNAGDGGVGSAIDTDAAEFARTVEVNLLGVQRLVSIALKPMVERRRGDVVFVTSDTVRAARPGTAAYVTSKWGLEGFARVLQLELEGTGVRASIVQPGQTRTEMGLTWDPEATAKLIDTWVKFGFARHPHFLPPSAVAEAVLTAVSVPRGTHLTLIEVQPEAPIVAHVRSGPNALETERGLR